jgi:hypothetical protein
MKIGLIDVDSHRFPNLALMKLSAYHKGIGDDVEWHFPLAHYDKVYKSKVFTFTPEYNAPIDADCIIKGGTGYNLYSILESKIDRQYPDYSLYNITDTAYGYLTRGCPRHCPFCIVSEKEGNISHRVNTLNSFWKGQKYIRLLDPNLLACEDRIELLLELKESGAWVDFTQGLDARLLTDEIDNLLKLMKIKMIHFALDNIKDSDIIIKNIKRFINKTGFTRRKIVVFILINYNNTVAEDLERIYTLRDIGAQPYIMIYEKEKTSGGDKVRLLQRYVNNKRIFNTIKRFEEFDRKLG